MIQVMASHEELTLLQHLSDAYPIGFSCNSAGEVWGCTRLGKNGPSDRAPLPRCALLAKLVACVLRVYPKGGRVRLSGSILYKCGTGWGEGEPVVQIVSSVLTRSA